MDPKMDLTYQTWTEHGTNVGQTCWWQVWTKSGPNMDATWNKHGPNMDLARTIHTKPGPNVEQTWTEHGPSIDLTCIKYTRTKLGPNMDLTWTTQGLVPQAGRRSKRRKEQTYQIREQLTEFRE